MIKSYDVIIVGGGPAGSSAARKLVRGGKKVLILDKYSFPRLKLCAGWITPETVRDLELDFTSYTGGIKKYNKLHFYIKGIHIPLPTTQYSIRRYELDDYLLRNSGADFELHKVKEIVNHKGKFVIDGLYESEYLIGAGGTNCPVYHTFFKEINPRSYDDEITTIEEEFPYDWKDPECRLWFMENKLTGYSWYVPKENGFLNVGIGGTLNGMKKNGMTIRDHWKLFTEKLKKKGLVTDYDFHARGYSYFLRKRVNKVRSGNAFIVGDAVGLATLDMGEGIGPSVKSGLLAADSILNGSPYSVDSIPKYSIPGILFPFLRKKCSDTGSNIFC